MLSGPILLLECVHIVACCLWLAASGSVLVSWDPEAWRLELAAIDHDPGPMLSPSIAHDL